MILVLLVLLVFLVVLVILVLPQVLVGPLPNAQKLTSLAYFSVFFYATALTLPDQGICSHLHSTAVHMVQSISDLEKYLPLYR